MKRILILLYLAFPLAGTAQALDTIYANENYNTALFFPEKIRQGTVGAPNFVFSYNQENPQAFGLLKASPGTSSNLLVLTWDGKVYSYILKYAEELEQLNYFLKKSASIGNEVPKTPSKSRDSVHAEGVPKETTIPHLVDKSFEYHLKNNNRKLKRKNKKGIILQVNELHYYKNELFMVFELENQSGLSFEPEYLRVYLIRGNKRKNASYQKLLLEPDRIYRFPGEISQGQHCKFLYALPKFTIGEGERIKIELKEKSGNRKVEMQIRRIGK